MQYVGVGNMLMLTGLLLPLLPESFVNLLKYFE